MRKSLLGILVLLTVSSQMHAASQRLIGSWKSNKPDTVEYLKKHTKLTPQQLDKISSILGKTIIVFDTQRMTMKSGTWEFSSKYTILNETKDTVTIESEEPGSRK